MDAALAHRAHSAFGLAGPAIFPRHGPRNVRLALDVVDAGLAEDARILILVLPWAIEGLIFAPDGHFPSSIAIGGRRHDVFRHELPDLGRFRTVELVPDVTALPSQHHARKVACLLGPPFRDAVARARRQVMTA